MLSKRLLLLAIVLAGLLCVRPAPAGLVTNIVPRQVIVYLKPGTNLTLFLLNYEAVLLDQAPGRPCYLLLVPLGGTEAAVAATMSKDARVIAAQPHYTGGLVELNGASPQPQEQWWSGFNGGGDASGYVNPNVARQVDYIQAPQRTGGAGVTVAVLDTGVSLLQPSLVLQSLGGWNFVLGLPVTADTPDLIDSNGNGVADEGVGHGTMVAGLVYRFAPQANLLPVKVLDSDGQGRLWDTIRGLYYAVDRGARVINTSWSTYQESPVLKQVVQDCWTGGAVIVASAGNDNLNRLTYPGAYANVLTVASLNADNTKAGFSNYGLGIELDAPGTGLVSLAYGGGYATGSGTSLSAPIVAAQAALIRSVRPTWTADQVRSRMLTTSRSVDALNPNYVGLLGATGQGLIDFDKSLAGL
jgi:subtilisin family serine protease